MGNATSHEGNEGTGGGQDPKPKGGSQDAKPPFNICMIITGRGGLDNHPRAKNLVRTCRSKVVLT